MSRMLDNTLLDALDSEERVELSSTVWRVTWSTRDPLAGSPGGGRWVYPGACETLYTSFEADGAIAEIYHHLSRAPVFSSSSSEVSELVVRDIEVVEISQSLLDQLGLVSDASNSGVELRDVGEAAFKLDYQGIVVPNVRWDCKNLVLFLDRLDLSSQIELTKSDPINWPAWKSSNVRDS